MRRSQRRRSDNLPGTDAVKTSARTGTFPFTFKR
jgi:hypothetical protein